MICSPELLVGWIFGWVMCPSSQGEEGEIKTIEQRKAAAGGAGLRHPCAIVPKTRQNNVGNRPHWSYLQCQQGKHFFFSSSVLWILWQGPCWMAGERVGWSACAILEGGSGGGFPPSKAVPLEIQNPF